ncbi:hypothetical protein F5148DRAFT_1240029 [Russula earlei]|uniref:Uncharacterized protein n=1 Tax=Russula earlei TaxID=71964 RepID=A0ACC0TVX4_9AGAM|nr:hypothetical protein F5148DRAFT_1240029 [Russula earlei]
MMAWQLSTSLFFAPFLPGVSNKGLLSLIIVLYGPSVKFICDKINDDLNDGLPTQWHSYRRLHYQSVQCCHFLGSLTFRSASLHPDVVANEPFRNLAPMRAIESWPSFRLAHAS